METKNYSKNKGWKKSWKQSLVHWTGVVALSFAFLISCQKKDSSTAAYVAPLPYNQAGVIGTCANCALAQTAFGELMSEGTSSFPVRIYWRLLGEQARLQQIAANGWSLKTYSGPLALTGEMTVVSQIAPYAATYYTGGVAGCVIPAGQYTLNTLQVGTMDGSGQFSVPQFEAISGGTRVTFTMGTAMIVDQNGDGILDRNSDHAYASIASVAVNGVQCTGIGGTVY